MYLTRESCKYPIRASILLFFLTRSSLLFFDGNGAQPSVRIDARWNIFDGLGHVPSKPEEQDPFCKNTPKLRHDIAFLDNLFLTHGVNIRNITVKYHNDRRITFYSNFMNLQRCTWIEHSIDLWWNVLFFCIIYFLIFYVYFILISSIGLKILRYLGRSGFILICMNGLTSQFLSSFLFNIDNVDWNIWKIWKRWICWVFLR